MTAIRTPPLRPLLLALAALAGLAALAAAQEKPPPEAPPKEEKWAKYYRERCEAFRASNAKLDADKTYAVFVGDSQTEGFPLAASFPGEPVLNRGISSDVTGVVGDRGILHRMDESVFACRPHVVFLQIGGNDLAGSNRPPEQFVKGVAQIVDQIRARLPKVPIVLTALFPKGTKYARREAVNPRVVAFNEGVRALAKERKLALLDLYAAYATPEGLLPDDLTNDGLHLKKDAYRRWADLARPHLRPK